MTVSGVGAFRWDVGADRLEATAELRQQLGPPPDRDLHSLDVFLQCIDTPDRSGVEEALRACAADGHRVDLDFRVRSSEATLTWLRLQGGRSTSAAGGVCVFGVCTDVTARRRDLAELENGIRSAIENEARLHALLEAAPLGIDILDADGNPVFYNPKAEEIHGFILREANPAQWLEAVHPDDRERIRRNWRQAASGRAPWSETYRFLHPDGRVVWVSGRAAPIRIDGQLVGFVGTLEDITAMKAAEADLEESLRREQAARAEAERWAREEAALRKTTAVLVASSTTEQVMREIARNALAATDADGAFIERLDIGTDAVIIVAMEGRAVAASGGRIPYRGSLAQQVIEGRTTLVVPRLADAQHQLPRDLVRLHPDDSALAVPLVDGGEPIGALILVRDHEKPPFSPDELRRAQTFADLAALAFRRIHLLEESEKRREELERIMASRARLMRGFSHDVKNPLGAADGFLGLLMEGIPSELNEGQKAYVARAREAIASSLKLIADLLALARAETGQVEIKWGPVDLIDAVRETGVQYSAKAREKGLRMEFHFPDHIPVIESDSTRVRQVLGNLLSNAVKYTEQGSVVVTVGVRSGADAPGPGEWVTAEVRDTGPGIAPEQQSMLFKEFSRLEPGKEGAGIGLAISRLVARALGGEITVSSEPGKGSVFTLWLPCVRGVGKAKL